MMGFGGGVAEVRNAGARDGVYDVAIKAVFFKEDVARAHGGWRSVHPDCRRRRSLMSEAWNIQLCNATNGKGQNAAQTGFARPSSRGIDDPCCTAPSGHYCQLFNTAN